MEATRGGLGASAGPLKHGLYFPNFGSFGDPRVVAQWAKDAELAGWDGFFIWDHVARPLATEVVDPCVALAAAAVATRRIRLGALVTPLPRRRPHKFARETASLDQLSEGRLIVGVGTGSAGGLHSEWESFGEELDSRRRGDMLDEALEVLLALWRGEAFAHHGTYFRAQSEGFLPKPLQRPRIPVWVGAYWPHKKPLRRAARFDGVFPLLRGEGDKLQQLRATLDFLWRERCALGTQDTAFEVAYPAAAPEPDPIPLRLLEELGVSWRLVVMDPPKFGGQWSCWPQDAMRRFLRSGPPRDS